RLLRIELRIAGLCQADAVRTGRIGIVAVRRTEIGELSAVDLPGHIAGCRQAEGFVEAWDPETFRPRAANRELLDRRHLEAQFRREVRLAGGVLVVATRRHELELLQDRRTDFEEAGLHIALARRTDRVDRVVAGVRRRVVGGVTARSVERLLSIRDTHGR